MRMTEFITESSKICPQCGMKGCTCEPGKCKCEPKPGYPKQVDEAANPAQQAAIAVNMKKHHQKPKGVAEGSEDSKYPHGEVKYRIVYRKSGERVEGIRSFNSKADAQQYAAKDPQYSVQAYRVKQGVAEGKIGADPYDRGYHNGQRMGSNSYHNPYSREDEPTEWDEYKSGFNMAQIELQNDLEDNGFSEGVAEGETWSKHNHKRVGGMSDKSVKSYRRSHPGSKIQTAVTTKPSKIKKGSKDAKRRASFCARMRGMKKHRTSAKTARDPNSNINKSLRRWHCESVEQLQELVMLAEQKIRNLKK